jgi:hypothetical protein
MKPRLTPSVPLFLDCATLASVSVCQTAEAARGRARQTPARITFVSDTGSLLRGPRFATEFGAVPSVSDLQAIKTHCCSALYLYTECFARAYRSALPDPVLDLCSVRLGGCVVRKVDI